MNIDSEKIIEIINEAKKILPELNVEAEFALSAINTSLKRSKLQAKKTSAAAKYTIATAAMRFVCDIHRAGKMNNEIVGVIKNIIKNISTLNYDASKNHEQTGRPKLPVEWNGKKNGPWKSSTNKKYPLTLTYNEHVPDGEWTVCIFGIPCLYGHVANEVIEDTEKLIDIIDNRNTNKQHSPKNIFHNKFANFN